MKLKHGKNAVRINAAIFFLILNIFYIYFIFSFEILIFFFFFFFLGALCISEAACSYWSWTDTNFPLSDLIHHCWLKSSNSGSKSSTGVVSGAKDCTGPQGNYILDEVHFLKIINQP